MLADSCIFRFLFESPKREARENVSWKIILVHQFYVNKYELGLDFAYVRRPNRSTQEQQIWA